MLTPCGAVTPQTHGEGFQSSTYDLPDFAREAWNATVFLETAVRRAHPGRLDSSTGSGTVIAHDEDGGRLLIATSAHVVPCEEACMIRVRFRRSGAPGHLRRRGRRVWSDPRMDLALLEVRSPPGALFQVARAASTITPESRVVAIGFPDLTLRPGAGEDAARQARRFSQGFLLEAPERFRADYFAFGSAVAAGHLTPGRVLVHSADLLPGSSGGPLIDAEGRVIGINTGSLARGEDSGCLVRPTREGPRCVHLAVAMDTVLEKVEAWKLRR